MRAKIGVKGIVHGFDGGRVHESAVQLGHKVDFVVS